MMPSFDLYQKMYGGMTQGQVRKRDSDNVMEQTWDEDISSRIGWFYSQEYDDEFDVEDDLHPEKSKTKIPINIKFYEIEYNSLAKDEVGQHLMFKPNFNYRDVIPYYDDLFKKPLHSMFPNGLYFDVADSEGVYHRWLCVGSYRCYGDQFPSYMALPCDYLAKWVYNNKKYESWCVSKYQSSYNAGVWRDRYFEMPENQRLLWFPFNNKTKTLFYNQRMGISQDRDIPLVWQCSKVEDTIVNGVLRLTWKQDIWHDNEDYVERDEQGNMLGIWCNYFTSNVPIEDSDQSVPTIHSEVTYSGKNTNVTIKGNAKKFTVTFYDADGEIALKSGQWYYTIDGNDATEFVEITTSDDDTTLSPNQIKLKFIGDDSHIGENLVVGYKSTDHVNSFVTMNLVGV